MRLPLDFEPPAAAALASLPSSTLDAAGCFATKIAAMLEADESVSLNNPAVNQLAREIFGAAAGFSRTIYDAAEAGLNLYLAKVGFKFATIEETLRWLKSEDERLPTQVRRDYRQVELQQFSSPHTEAFLVVWAAALRPGMRVLEPSAGTGNIAVLARLTGALVGTNEVDPRRRSLLRLQGFEPTDVDAERLDNLLPPDKTYDAIVMNPPFSATGGRVQGHDGLFGARHVEQALLRLNSGGRLVAIVGAELAFDRRKASKFWGRIQETYRVRANLGINGREYSRFGTTYDHHLIVIDHDGRATSAGSIETDIATKLLTYSPIAAAWETAKEKYSLRQWTNEESILVLGNSDVSRAAIDALNRCIIKRLSDLTLAQSESFTRRNWFFLDEASEAGRLDGLISLVKKGRSKGAVVVMAAQGITGFQSEHLYGVHRTSDLLAQFGNRFFGRLECPDTSEYASRMVGEQEVEQITISRTYAQHNSTTHNQQIVTRRAVLPVEFMDVPPCTRENGLSGYFLVRSVGCFQTTLPGDELFGEMLIPPDPNVPAIIDRPVESQYLRKWTPERAARFGVPPAKPKRNREQKPKHEQKPDIDPFAGLDDLDS